MLEDLKSTIHADAARSFNEIADELVKKLSDERGWEVTYKNAFVPDVSISKTITDSDITGKIEFGKVDWLGNETDRYFVCNNRQIGLHGEDYSQFDKLSISVYKIKSIHNKISLSFIKDTIFEWLEKTYTKEIKMNMVDYLIEECEKAIEELEVWIPIAETYIQSEFRIGQIEFKTIKKDLIDKWADRAINKYNNQEADSIRKSILRNYRKLQGIAAGTFKIIAEKERALELARLNLEDALSILRYYCPANFDPLLVSNCVAIGNDKSGKAISIIIDKDGKSYGTEEILKPYQKPWLISTQDLRFFERGGFNKLCEIIDKNEMNDFQTKLLEAINLYSRNCLAQDISTKLLFILSSLETLLLKDPNEPIVQNISERIAFLIGKNASARMEIAANIRRLYDIRSKFVHHGKEISELETIRKFMVYAWTFYQVLIANSDNIPNHLSLIISIERRKFI